MGYVPPYCSGGKQQHKSCLLENEWSKNFSGMNADIAAV